MNRREALAALTALPAVQLVKVEPLKPSDVIVISYEGAVSAQRMDDLREVLKQVWPQNRVVVLGDGAQLKIVEG